MPNPRSTKRQLASSVASSVAASVAASTPLLPHFPRLFAGIDALGSSPRWVVSVLSRVAPPKPTARVLDIAGGKGAVAVALARRFSCRVELSDACEPFIAAANDLAARHAVAHLVSTRLADAARELARARRDPAAPADLALMLNLWPFDRAAPALRHAVKPGGVYAFDDAVALRASPDMPSVADVDALIASLGDRVLARVVRRRDAIHAAHAALVARLTVNARALSRQHPRLRPHLAEFLRHHRAAGRLLEGDFRPVLWVVRRGGR